MLRGKAGQTRNHFASSQRPRQRDPQCAAQAVHAARGIFGIIEIAEDLLRPLEKHPPGLGQRNVPRGAQEKLDTQPRLEVRHHPRYRGLRHPELARDAREAAGLAGADEGGQFPEPVTHTWDV